MRWLAQNGDGQGTPETRPLSSSYLCLTMRKFIVLLAIAVIGTGIYLFINRSMPYSDSSELLSAEISIDSVWTLGPTAAMYDKTRRQYYWLKSYSSFNQLQLDTLKHKKINIQYMKFLKGPLENRIFRMEIDSVVIFDQVIERN